MSDRDRSQTTEQDLDTATTRKVWVSPRIRSMEVATSTRAGFAGVLVESTFYTDS